MKIHLLAGLSALAVPLTAHANWSYDHAYNCLKALTTGISAPGAPVIFNRTGTALFAGAQSGVNGIYVLTPKAAHFFSKDEMTRSGDASSTQTKIAVVVESSDPKVFKIFHNPTAAQPQERLSFASANEFDRHLELAEATDDSIRVPINTVMGNTLVKARALIDTNRQGLKEVLDQCEATALEFNVDMGNGTESSFRTELKRMQDKLKPSVFSMEYWFPKKSTN